MKNKCVEILENPEAGDRCPCRLLDHYISKLPVEAKDKDLFYVHPVEKPKLGAAWYYSIPIGRNKLAQMVPEICRIGGISGHKTNLVSEPLVQWNYMKLKFLRRLSRRELVIGHLNAFECTKEPAKNSIKLSQISSSSQSTYHTQITKIDTQNTAASSSKTGILPKLNFTVK